MVFLCSKIEQDRIECFERIHPRDTPLGKLKYVRSFRELRTKGEDER